MEAYYDILFADGNERQTVESHLSAVPTTPAAPQRTLDLPFDVVSRAVRNFATFHGRDVAHVRIRDVEESSAGIHGWARPFIPPAPAPPPKCANVNCKYGRPVVQFAGGKCPQCLAPPPAPAMPTVHHGIWCNECGRSSRLSIVGPRWNLIGQDYDLCDKCFWKFDESNIERHRFRCLE